MVEQEGPPVRERMSEIGGDAANFEAGDAGVKREAEWGELSDAAKRQMLQPAEPSSEGGRPPSPAGEGGAERTPLPGGWEEFVSARTGKAYWYNATSLQTTWDRPGVAKRSPSTTTPPLSASLDDPVEEVQQQLADGLRIDHRNGRVVRSALHQAASRGYGSIVQLLLDQGADVEANAEAGGTDGDTPLHRAAHGGHAAIVELLLDAGARVNVRTFASYSPLHNADGDTPLHLAAQGRHLAIVRLLLDNGAWLNNATTFGYTPLHRSLGPQWGQQPDWGHAAQKRMLDVVQLLLDRGADVHYRTRDGKTAEDFALAQSHQVVELLRVAKRRAECEAFAMGHHEQLGARSLVRGLDAGLVRMILDPA